MKRPTRRLDFLAVHEVAEATKTTELHFDFPSAVIALLALTFSIYT